MKRTYYCIYDDVSEVACNPFPASNDADAIRTFEYTISNNPVMDSNRDNFVLKKVFTFDTKDCGVVTFNEEGKEVLLIPSDVLRGSRFEKEGV